MTDNNNKNIMGQHAIIDHIGIISLYTEERLKKLLSAAAYSSRSTILNMEFHTFGKGMGVTGVLMLAESHISIHTWPERDHYSAIDIFVCSDNDRLHAAVAVIRAEDPRGIMAVTVINRSVPAVIQLT